MVARKLTPATRDVKKSTELLMEAAIPESDILHHYAADVQQQSMPQQSVRRDVLTALRSYTRWGLEGGCRM